MMHLSENSWVSHCVVFRRTEAHKHVKLSVKATLGAKLFIKKSGALIFMGFVKQLTTGGWVQKKFGGGGLSLQQAQAKKQDYSQPPQPPTATTTHRKAGGQVGALHADVGLGGKQTTFQAGEGAALDPGPEHFLQSGTADQTVPNKHEGRP